MAVVSNWDINTSFWKLHDQLAIEPVFKEFKDKDKSKDQIESSKIMWSIAYMYDNDSDRINWPIKDKIKFVETEIIKKKDTFTEDKYKVLIEKFNSFQDSAARRQLKEWSRIMDEKTELMRGMKYNIGNWETIEKMLTSNSKLYSELERIESLLDNEGIQDRAKGGSEESLAEKGELDVYDK